MLQWSLLAVVPLATLVLGVGVGLAAGAVKALFAGALVAVVLAMAAFLLRNV